MTALRGMSLVRVVAPALEPVTLGQAKAQLRVFHDEDDALIERLIVMARDHAESVTRLSIMPQTWELSLDYWWRQTLELPRFPLQSVESISYVDEEGATQTLDPALYTVYPAYRRLAWNPNAEIPKLQEGTLQRVTVRYVLGWASREDLPAALVQAMLVNLTMYYNNRGDMEFQEPAAYRELWLSVCEDFL